MTEKIECTADLISKYLHNKLTSSEEAGLQAWIQASPENTSKFKELTNPDILAGKIDTWLREKEAILPQPIRKKPRKSRYWGKFLAGEPFLKQILKPLKQTIKAR